MCSTILRFQIQMPRSEMRRFIGESNNGNKKNLYIMTPLDAFRLLLRNNGIHFTVIHKQRLTKKQKDYDI